MAEWAEAKTMMVTMNVDIDSDGYIAQSGDTAVGVKSFNLQGVSTDASLAQASNVFTAFIGDIAGGRFDSLSATRTIKTGVKE